MNVVLVMFRENGERRSFSLTRDVTVIGRREDADFRIPLSDVSRKHSRLIKDGDALLIEDLGSSNGTYHNGVRVQEAEVHAGDTIQVGPIQFVVQIDGIPSEDELLGNTGAVSTHLANNNFAMGAAAVGAAAAMGGGEHEEALVEAEELEEIEDDQFVTMGDAGGDAGELEEVAELEEIGELEELPADDLVAMPMADDVVGGTYEPAVATTDDIVDTSDDLVETTDELETLDDVVAAPADLIGSAEDDEIIAESETGESIFERPATPVRPAAPGMEIPLPPEPPLVEPSLDEPAEVPEPPLSEPPPVAPVLEPESAEADALIEAAPLAEEVVDEVNAFDEGVEPAEAEAEIVDDDFIEIDTDHTTGEDDVLIDFGDDEQQK